MSQFQPPDLSKSLQGFDLGHLQIIASAWELDKQSFTDVRSGLQYLSEQLAKPEQYRTEINALNQNSRLALDDLVKNGGQISWSLFTRRYGKIREMGPGRRDREQPHHNPSSVTEDLWYRGLIGRSFFDSPSGPAEFAYIPAEFLAMAGKVEKPHSDVFGEFASSSERAKLFLTGDQLLDHSCTYLAAIRSGQFDESAYAGFTGHGVPLVTFLEFIHKLLTEAGCIDQAGLPVPEATRVFLENERNVALTDLVQTWLKSQTINEMRLVPGLAFEGEWENNPLSVRQAILDFIAAAPGQQNLTEDDIEENKHSKTTAHDRPFVSLEAFLNSIQQLQPDFQRPAGDYDSWFIRDLETGNYLRGFESWPRIDGGLIRFVITGPLHWLGITDLAGSKKQDQGIPESPAAFRFSHRATQLLQGRPPGKSTMEDQHWQVNSNAILLAPRLSPRSARYQLARFADSEGFAGDNYRYRFTPKSLSRARAQGLSINHLLGLLRRHSKTIPPSLVSALERWDEQGSAAQLDRVAILRLKSPDLLQALRSGRAARFLGDPLGPATIIVKPGAEEKVLNILLEMGYLGEIAFSEKD